MTEEKNYTPALRFNLLTPCYDWIVQWSSKEKVFKNKLIEQAVFTNEDTVLDVGCGTGTLLGMLKHEHLDLHGVDIDPNCLLLAKQKLNKFSLSVKLQKGSATFLPYEQDSFDHVFCSLMFHHLTDDDKVDGLKEIYRVLKSGGELHFADWGRPSSRWSRWRFLIVQLLDGFATTNACLSDFVVKSMRDTGFTVMETGRVNALVGEIVLLNAKKL